ncbi:MAG: acetyl ornithine aminotransferase family protein [Candidatus Acidiferrales bacterium]
MIDLTLPRIVTSLPGPLAEETIRLDGQLTSPSYTRNYPLVVKRARGAMVEDVDGNVFLDFTAGISVLATGHCHPAVVEAIQKQADQLIHMSGTDFYYPLLVDLAGRLAAIAPGKAAKRVFFCNSGTEAVEAAIKLARYHTRRDKLVAFYGAFHGRTLGSLSLTASKAVQRKRFGALLGGVVHIPYPNTYRCPYGQAAPDCCSKCFWMIENEFFKKIVDPEEIAAVVIEPIQGEGGHVPAPSSFLVDLQRMCRKHGILLISDEVQSGMGRTGKWWAGDHAGLEPDIICVAKGIASGMPLGAIIATDDVMDWSRGSHGSTFGGNPVSIAAALATIDLIERQYMQNACRLGQFIMDRIQDWPTRFSMVGDVRGKGLMIGIEIVRDKRRKERAPELRDKIVHLAFQKGLLLLDAGENSIRLTPPLVIDEQQADFAIRVLESVFAETALDN